VSRIKIRHPNLPGREREVAASAEPFYVNAGWEVVTDEEEEKVSPEEGGEPSESEQADKSQEQSEERKGGSARTSRRTKAEDTKEAKE
jgi:hypothetical protein